MTGDDSHQVHPDARTWRRLRLLLVTLLEGRKQGVDRTACRVQYSVRSRPLTTAPG